jgi:hypothetical protein
MNQATMFSFDILTRQIAKTSLLAMFVLFLAYTIAFLFLVMKIKIPRWTTIAAFENARGQPWFRLLTFCQGIAFLTPLFFLSFVISLNVAVVPGYRALAGIALATAVLFALLSSVYYFIQFALTTLDLSPDANPTLEHLYQLNPRAIITAINILGWAFFFGLSCFCLAPLFIGSAGGNVFAAILLANGLVCWVGLAGYLRKTPFLVSLFSNLMGLAVLAFSLLGFFII